MTKEYFLRLYEYVAWAHGRVLEVLRRQAEDNERARKWLSHILAAEQVWLTRLRGADSAAVPVWPDLTLAECAQLAAQNHKEYQQFLNGLTEADFERAISYKNTKGVSFNTSIGDVLTHVAFHGTYHRGHIATLMRAAGQEPINTDFITFTRE
jgi:uncharacterized damage-inducible protein DinB